VARTRRVPDRKIVATVVEPTLRVLGFLRAGAGAPWFVQQLDVGACARRGLASNLTAEDVRHLVPQVGKPVDLAFGTNILDEIQVV
jgi:hypothetical protein